MKFNFNKINFLILNAETIEDVQEVENILRFKSEVYLYSYDLLTKSLLNKKNEILNKED